jgi:O-antigen ligase
MLGFLLVMLVSAVVNGVRIWSHKYIDLFFKAVVLYFLVSRLVDTPRRLKITVFALVAATTYLAYLAWKKYRSGELDHARPYMFSSYHTFGQQLVLTVPLMGAMLALRVWLPIRLVLLAAIPLYVLDAMRSTSRATMVGMAMALGLLVWYHRKRWYWVLPAVPLVAYAIAHNPEVVMERLESIWTHELEGEEDRSIASRFEQMRTAKAIVSANPLFGIGPRQFFQRYGDYQRFEDKAKHGAQVLYTMHCVPLLILCEEGLIGGAAFGLVIVSTLLNARYVSRKSRGDPEMRAIAVIGAGSAMGFLAWSAYSVTQPQMWVINIYMMVALVMSARRIVGARVAEQAAATQRAVQAQRTYYPEPVTTEVVFS